MNVAEGLNKNINKLKSKQTDVIIVKTKTTGHDQHENS
jgi:hypothetical protein